MNIEIHYVILDLKTNKYFCSYRTSEALTSNIEDADKFLTEDDAIKTVIDVSEYSTVMENIIEFKIDNYYTKQK